MNILVLHSSQQMGPDPVVGAICQEFSGQAGNKVVAVDVDDDVRPVSQTEFNLVVILSALDWFLRERLAIGGRFTACAASFGLDDFLSLMRVNLQLHELGLKAVYSNCAQGVRQVTAAVPVKFVYKPVTVLKPPPLTPANPPVVFGTVLPNVADRDFSQVKWTRDFVKKNNGSDFKIYISKSEKMRLPADLEECAVRVTDNVFQYFGAVKYFVPAPRITDYRAGVIPPEIIQAMASGSKPLLIGHPNIRLLEKDIEPLSLSLGEYGALLLSLIKGTSEVRSTAGIDYMTTPRSFCESILMAYHRATADASA